MLQRIKEKQAQFRHVLLVLFLLSIPFSIKMNGLIMLLIALSFLLEGNFRDKWSRIRTNTTALLLMGFYLLLVLGVFYSENTGKALFDLEKTASFLIFPLVFASQKPMGVLQYHRLLKAFVLGCVLACALCLLYALYHYFFLSPGAFLFYHHFGAVLGFHAVYFSMYLLMCLCITLYLFRQVNYGNKQYYLPLLAFLLVNLLILSSKTVIIATFVLVNFQLLYYFTREQRLYKIVILAVVINILCAFAIYRTPYVKDRFKDVLASSLEVVSQEKYQYDTPFSGLTIRLVFWKSVLKVLQEQKAWLYGVGTGDAQNLLNGIYRQMNLYTGNSELGDSGYLGHDPHNQFLTNLLKQGLVGLGYLICLLAWPIRQGWRPTNKLHLAFLFIIGITSLSESILERQKGIVFFAFFYSFLIVNQYSAGAAEAGIPDTGKARKPKLRKTQEMMHILLPRPLAG